MYWSYLKIPAQIIIISSILPYAFTLLAEILGDVQFRAPYTITGQFKVFITGVITVFLTGTGIFWSEKQDSYAFVHLVIAICLKTIVMLLKKTSEIQHLSRIYQKISSWTTSRTSRVTSTLSGLIPTSYAPTICSLVNRIFHRFATPHFSTTVILFLADFLFQLPKRWSFFTSRCWGLAVGILMTDALIRYLERSLQKGEVQSACDIKGNNKSSITDELATGGDDHFRNTIRRATESCTISFLALLISSTSSATIDSTASKVSSPLYINQSDRNAKSVHFMLIICLCWLVVWASTARRSTLTGENGVANQEAEIESARRKVLSVRRPKLFIAILGLLPLVLAVGKHTMSGTMLGRVYDHYDQVVSFSRMTFVNGDAV